MLKKSTKTTLKIGVPVVLIIFVLAYVLLQVYPGNAFFYPGAPAPNCAIVNGTFTATCNQQLNGIVTAISQINSASNFPGLNGPVFLVNFVLNGAGQYVIGTTDGSIAHIFNSTAATPNNQINIQAKLNYQKLFIPYTYSGTDIYLDAITIHSFNFGGYAGGVVTVCAEQNQTQSSPYYSFVCSGPSANNNDIAILNAYTNKCTSANGVTVLIGSVINGVSSGSGGTFPVSGPGSYPFASQYKIQCQGVTANKAGSVYYAGSPTIAESVNVTYTNATGSKSFNLNTVIPQSSSGAILSAQIYGYLTGALNTYIGTTSPMVYLPSGSNQPRFYQAQPLATIFQLNQISNGCYQSAGVNVGGQIYSNIYSSQSINSCIAQQNTNVNNFLSTQLQQGTPFSSISYISGSVASTIYPYSRLQINAGGSGIYGMVDVTQNPIYYPEIQMIVSASTVKTLSLTVPVAYPSIVSVAPNPVIFQSGSNKQVVFTVLNNASVSGAAYIVVRATNGTVVGQTANFNLPAGQASTEAVQLSGYNPNLALLNATWKATVYSSQMTSINSNFSFNVGIKPNCPTGAIFVNNTNCVSTSHSCNLGFAWNGTGCQTTCSAPSVFNASTGVCFNPKPSTCDSTTQICEIPTWVYYAIGAAASVIAILVIVTRKKLSQSTKVWSTIGGALLAAVFVIGAYGQLESLAIIIVAVFVIVGAVFIYKAITKKGKRGRK